MANNPTVAGVVSGALGPLSGGSSAGSNSGLTDQLTQLTQQLQQLQTVNQAAVTAEQANTQAISLNSTTKTSGGSSTGSTVGGTIESVLGLGSGLSPLITGLLSLFGGGGGSGTQAPLANLILPPSASVNAGISEAASTQSFGVNYGQGGQPRPNSQGPNSQSSSAAPATQITVQVQALDSQSFLDHSNDIAMAVRQAMLESNVLNDVIQAL